MKNFWAFIKYLGFLVIVANLASSCGNTIMPQDPPLQITTADALESATQLISSQANGVENSYGQITSSDVGTNPVAASCQSGTRSSCTTPGNEDSVVWNSCQFASGLIITGGWSEVFSSSYACTHASSPMIDGSVVTRRALSPGFRSTFGSGVSKGASFFISTAAQKMFDGTSLSNAGVHISQSAGVRTILIAALRSQLRGLYGLSYSDVTVTGTVHLRGSLAAGTRAIQSGDSLISYDNIKKQKLINDFSGVVWTNPNCCYPTQGMASSALTLKDSTVVSTELDFSNSCGQATFIDENGVASAMTLKQCY